MLGTPLHSKVVLRSLLRGFPKRERVVSALLLPPPPVCSSSRCLEPRLVFSGSRGWNSGRDFTFFAVADVRTDQTRRLSWAVPGCGDSWFAVPGAGAARPAAGAAPLAAAGEPCGNRSKAASPKWEEKKQSKTKQKTNPEREHKKGNKTSAYAKTKQPAKQTAHGKRQGASREGWF